MTYDGVSQLYCDDDDDDVDAVIDKVKEASNLTRSRGQRRSLLTLDLFTFLQIITVQLRVMVQ